MKKWAIVLVGVFVFALFLAGFKTIAAVSHPIKYQAEILRYSSEFGLRPELVASVINTESHFNKKAKSNKGAIGLMQIKLSTANFIIEYYKLNERIDEDDLLEPNTNIRFGAMYICYLNKKFENIYTALAAYNAGETVVRSWLRNDDYSNDGQTLKHIPFGETRNYVLKIKNNLKFYRQVF